MGHPLLHTKLSLYEWSGVQRSQIFKWNHILSISSRLIEFLLIWESLPLGVRVGWMGCGMHIHAHLHTCINMIISIANGYPHRYWFLRGIPLRISSLIHMHTCMCVCVHVWGTPTNSQPHWTTHPLVWWVGGFMGGFMSNISMHTPPNVGSH